MKIILPALILLAIVSCSSGDNKYEISNYYDPAQRDSVLTEIITYLSTAPVYTTMDKRFEPQHRNFYASLLPKYSIYKYFIADDGTNYFYVIRPASKIGDLRAVGGHFKMNKHFKPVHFTEVFVTPVFPEAELKTRTVFLFDEMIKGTIDPYLKMKTYAQWPNRASIYDSTTYEWKLNKDSIN
jgi:hypothetical protein